MMARLTISPNALRAYKFELRDNEVFVLEMTGEELHDLAVSAIIHYGTRGRAFAEQLENEADAIFADLQKLPATRRAMRYDVGLAALLADDSREALALAQEEFPLWDMDAGPLSLPDDDLPDDEAEAMHILKERFATSDKTSLAEQLKTLQRQAAERGDIPPMKVE